MDRAQHAMAAPLRITNTCNRHERAAILAHKAQQTPPKTVGRPETQGRQKMAESGYK
ncbi:hypothetical protein [Caballeronia fortuita]|uniref:hypothetical protein n=1 Tax=Caballeronia fortuita TaxID=1777138 RepID=UPI0012FD1A85|nr:hypothetical protein [Caballeronia fortuita]